MVAILLLGAAISRGSLRHFVATRITAGILPIGVWFFVGFLAGDGGRYGTREGAEDTSSAPTLLWIGVVWRLDLYHRFSSPCLLARCAGARVVAVLPRCALQHSRAVRADGDVVNAGD